MDQLARAQAALAAQAEQIEGQLKPIAMESSRDEPVDAWLAVQQVRHAGREHQAQLAAALGAVTTYASSL